MQRRKYASSRPGSLYATKRVMHQLQPNLSNFLSLSNRPITAQSFDQRLCQGSAHMTSDANLPAIIPPAAVNAGL